MTKNGRKVANFSLATNENWTDGTGQEHEEVSWHKCEAWAGHADVIETWVRKGQQLMVEGRIKYTTSEKGGKTAYYTCIVVSNFIMLGDHGGRKESRPTKGQKPYSSSQFIPRDEMGEQAGYALDREQDDLPF